MATDPLSSDPLMIINRNVIVVHLTPKSVNPVSRSMKFKLQAIPCGDYANFAVTQAQQYVLKQDVNVAVGAKTLKYKKGTIMSPRDISVSFDTGIVNDYPFDSYVSKTVYIDATVKNGNSTDLAHVDVVVSGAIQGWLMNATSLIDISGSFYGDKVYDGRLLQLEVTVKRSFIVKAIILSLLPPPGLSDQRPEQFFVGLVTFNMWMLGILDTLLALTFWHRGPPNAPVPMAMPIGAIFALYGLRSSQPGVPAIGCFMDTIAYFWCTVLVAGSGVLLILQYQMTRPREGPPPKDESFWTIFFEAYLPHKWVDEKEEGDMAPLIPKKQN
ncbi:hypothetical protein HK405_015075 [Cladochytrium tenue]|nr:hypothetical protein HK405_015075 [Cladochytrium tenue]